MCGINGIYSYRDSGDLPSREELIRSRDHMRLRGPDAAGEWVSGDGRLAFGHRRLAIIDLSELGNQPMRSADGRLTVVFNGEIYNYQALREELIAAGAQFVSHSDTEVLLHLYRRDGEAMVSLLRGMFAFAIWDEDRKRLFLARDPHGIKPLYYCDDGRQFRFASQAKAILAGGGVAAAASPGGLVGFLLWGSVPSPLTFYQGIRALPAGHTMTVSAGRVGEAQPYWRLGEAIALSMEAAEQVPAGEEVEYLREALLDSVRAHLVADVPIGAFLSGGLDSSVLVGLAHEAGHDIRTFTVTADEFIGNSHDEAPFAAEVARHFGLPHEIVTLTVQDAINGMPAFLDAMDQPSVDGINTWFVSEATKQAGLKVVISGLGGDELLGGYETFDSLQGVMASSSGLYNLPGISRMFQWGAILLAHMRTDYPSRNSERWSRSSDMRVAYHRERGLFMPWELGKLLKQDVVRAGLEELGSAPVWEIVPNSLNAFAKISVLESTRYMRNQLLRDADWVGMAHSMELRTPLVDQILSERVAGLAATGRLGRGKAALPHTLRQGLPEQIKTMEKKGFTLPIWHWLYKVDELSDWKRNTWLKRKATNPYARWGYAVLRHTGLTGDLLL